MAVFSDLWQEVRTAVGEREDIDAIIKSAVNDAMVDLILLFHIRQGVLSVTQITAQLTNLYSLEDNVLDVINVRNDTDSVPIEKGDWYEYDSMDLSAEGTPTKWFVEGNYLVLYSNSPDADGITFTYRYMYRPEDMVDNADPYPLPREWERPNKLLAKSYVFEVLGQSDMAAKAYQQMTAIVGARHTDSYYEKINAKDSSVDFGSVGAQDPDAM